MLILFSVTNNEIFHICLCVCLTVLLEGGAHDETSYGTYMYPYEDEKTYYISRALIMKRVITVAICAGVLLMGVILRICLPVPDTVDVLTTTNGSLETGHYSSLYVTTEYSNGTNIL